LYERAAFSRTSRKRRGTIISSPAWSIQTAKKGGNCFYRLNPEPPGGCWQSGARHLASVNVLVQNASFGLTPENTSVIVSPSLEIHLAGSRYPCVPATSHCRCRIVVHGPHGSGASKSPHPPAWSYPRAIRYRPIPASYTTSTRWQFAG